jgi:hypothetical protein
MLRKVRITEPVILSSFGEAGGRIAFEEENKTH